MSIDVPTWLEISLPAVAENTRTLLFKTGVPLMAVVKADAYGFGAVEVAKTALKAGAAWLAVARFNEAEALRRAGVVAPVLVFGGVTPGEVDRAIGLDVTLTLHSFELAEMYAQRANELGAEVTVHLKVDTGMGRFGVFAEDAPALAQRSHTLGGINIEGIYSHLSQVDSEPDDDLTPVQLRRFRQALQGLQVYGVEPKWVHCTNSAAALACPQARFNLTRAGSALLGIRPFYYLPFLEGFRRALTWKARLASCKRLPAGWGVGYGQAYVTQEEEWIGVVPVGYGDGFRRSPFNEVLVGGRRAPVVGKVCSDMAMVRLPGPLPEGAEVVILGEQRQESIQIEDLSERWGISQAAVTAGITARVPRVYR